MQKVERKKHREGKPRRWIWLAAAGILLAGSVTAAILAGKPAEIPREERHWGMLIDRTAGELRSVTVQRRGEDAWTLVRTEDGELMPESGAEWTVETQQGSMLQEAMTQLRYEEILTEDPAVYRENPGEFGLEPPLVTVTGRYTDGGETTVRIGNDTGLEEGWYYMTVEGDDRLYAVSAGTVQDLDLEYSLLHPVPRPEIYGALLDRITIREGERLLAEWELQGRIDDRDAGSNWAVTQPFRAPADEETIQNLKKNAENLRLGTYTAPATEENLEKFGLKHPGKTLVFHMAAGSTGTVSDAGVYDVTDHGESTVTLEIGDARDEMADYVRFGEEIFTVSRFTLSAFTDLDPMATAARYPVLTPLASLESLTVEEGGRTLEYVLSGGEETGEETGAGICLLNGEHISREAFDAAYDRLLTVTFSGVLPEGAKWEEPYKKYTLRTLSGGTHTIELRGWDGIHDAVTVDGATLFYLIRGGMTPLPGEEEGTY